MDQPIPMPSNYHCKSCGLCACIGWFHYHRFETGYGSETHFVCTDCGTIHAIRHAIPHKFGEPYYDYSIEVTDSGPNTVELLKLIREVKKCSLQECKTLYSSIPFTLITVTGEHERDAWTQKLRSIGADVDAKEIAKHERKIPQRTDVLLVQPKPLFCQRLGSEHLKYDDWIERDVEGPVEGETGVFYIDLQPCGTCGKHGKLTCKFEADVVDCPHCGNNDFRFSGGWVT